MPDMKTKISKLRNLNTEMLGLMVKAVLECSVHVGACPGDCGEIHCILCKGNVLSTDELRNLVWEGLAVDSDCEGMSDCPCAEETREVIVHNLYYENVYTCVVCGAVRRKCNVRA